MFERVLRFETWQLVAASGSVHLTAMRPCLNREITVSLLQQLLLLFFLTTTAAATPSAGSGQVESYVLVLNWIVCFLNVAGCFLFQVDLAAAGCTMLCCFSCVHCLELTGLLLQLLVSE